ncbi:pyruvate synthase [Candidatus Falkowbacteria bacterium RBG_13_39_14]|uniref:Pyruvate synthase n=1 Tax=Candidatus Falkowbacteria bacterium RBG_13_39_14 TaxID=1797985 RepID=A0A1F5S3D1_9BACT|nr:MAG: pyruvate synthase [Candidatus Falkowbacteria bacterium RBG_13_39_14]
MSIQKYNLSVSPGSTKSNKTGGWRTFRPVFNHDKCVGCGNCERVCPEGVCFAVFGKKYFECDLDYCKGCGICAKECPAGAIKMEREEK